MDLLILVLRHQKSYNYSVVSLCIPETNNQYTENRSGVQEYVSVMFSC